MNPVTDVVVMLLETPFRRWTLSSQNDLLKVGKPIPIVSILVPICYAPYIIYYTKQVPI